MAVVLSIALTFSLIIPISGFAKANYKSSADQKIKLTDAIDTAKKTLDINTENYNFNYNYNENQNGRSTWDLSWTSKATSGGHHE